LLAVKKSFVVGTLGGPGAPGPASCGACRREQQHKAVEEHAVDVSLQHRVAAYVDYVYYVDYVV
jgi:hypothetical protein